jgi:alpha-galactosidase
MMKPLFRTIFATFFSLCLMPNAMAAKPLKIFILVGQSNMEGHAAVRSFDNLALDPAEPELLKAMRQENGEPTVCDDVYISYATGNAKDKDTPLIKEGKLTAGFGAQFREPKIGPEYTFGIYMQKHLKEPILIIKAAWGGKSLHTDFRPPSAGPSEVGDAEATGHYYRLMMQHVKNVLNDPGKVHPAYDKAAGHELAGFVWFQGWNDMVNSKVYPQRTQPGGYDKYSEVFAHLIRDVRKELEAPGMPFVIGVMGVGGISTAETEAARAPRYRGITPGFRASMAKPASMPEFKGSVFAVETAPFWDVKLEQLDNAERKAKGAVNEMLKNKKVDRAERDRIIEEEILKLMSKEDINYLRTGKTNQGFHYMGSARVMGKIGKAFADALAK